MIELMNQGTYLLNGSEMVPADSPQAPAVSPEEAAKNTMAYKIIQAHNTSGDPKNLKIRFDMISSHDITYVSIIQTAKASGMTEFPLPFILTNCHNSMCAMGGTINEDDHLFGLSAAKKYGGIMVPTNVAVIHQFMREMKAGCGKMILSTDSHTRYGALGTVAMGEGGGELVKQLLRQTYDIKYPKIVGCYMKGKLLPGVGPQDVALAIVGATYKCGFVKNKLIEFVGPGITDLAMDYRLGIDVMMTETTCLSTMWRTDETTQGWLKTHGREEEYYEINPGPVAYYDQMMVLDLSRIRPMIAMPFHPSNVYTIKELVENPEDILRICEKEIFRVTGKEEFRLTDKIINGKIKVEQGVIGGCAGGTYTNVMEAAHILSGSTTSLTDFNLNVYPASMPVQMDLMKKGALADLMAAGAIIKPSFCGPCFGMGDTPGNHGLSIRHTTRNFVSREGSLPERGQIAAVALMDSRSIAATALNGGLLTSAEDVVDPDYKVPAYEFDDRAYKQKLFNGVGNGKKELPLVMGPNITDWPEFKPLGENLLLHITAKMEDAITTTDDLLPSGEASSYRSNPQYLATFALSRRKPSFVPESKKVAAIEAVRQELAANAENTDSAAGNAGYVGNADSTTENVGYVGNAEIAESNENEQIITWLSEIRKIAGFGNLKAEELEIGGCLAGNIVGDGSAREQAVSSQRVLGGRANIAKEYATKRYFSNLCNWGMVPFLTMEDLPIAEGDDLFIPGIKEALQNHAASVTAYVLGKNTTFTLKLPELQEKEVKLILSGCLINYNRQL